ncbi:von Willebrand factor, type A [Calothrix sp. PCC 7716]|nr:von Willebrand factor, type A [Calothrix sp. PCC 7716]
MQPSQKNSPPPPQVDIMFALDITTSMQGEIYGVQQGIRDFATQISSKNLDSQIGLIAFRDRFAGEEPTILTFKNDSFTKDSNDFRHQVGQLGLNGGGADEPESSLDALTLAAQQPFRPKATKVILLITDAPPKVPDRETQSLASAASFLQNKKINQLHLVIQDSERSAFEGLQSAVPGEIFSLSEAASGRSGFERILPRIGQTIAETTIQGLQSTGKYSSNQAGLLTITTAISTGILAIGIALALIIGQNHYQHRRLLTLSEASVSTFGSLVAGMIAGATGQLLFSQIANIPNPENIEIIIKWAFAGALFTGIMSLFIPQLKKLQLSGALLAGGISGALAGGGLLLTANSLGHFFEIGGFLAQFAAALIFGFCIQLLAGLFFGLVAGLTVIFFGQLLLLPILDVSILEVGGRIVCWAILGLLVGGGTRFFVPNLQLSKALFGGTIGGSLGAIGFIIAAIFGDIAGLLLGAAVLGFFIGLMIAWAEQEQLNSETYLLVHWAPTEKTSLLLGTKPILIGSSPNAQIPLNASEGFTPVTAKIYQEGGNIVMQFDLEYATSRKMKKMTHELNVGDCRKFGNITIEVQSSINKQIKNYA